MKIAPASAERCLRDGTSRWPEALAWAGGLTATHSPTRSFKEEQEKTEMNPVAEVKTNPNIALNWRLLMTAKQDSINKNI
jgi:hypothetical protein